MAVSAMRGLSVFISDIRNCQNKEQERLRVDKELANIRTHFKGDRNLTPYERKKYVWKLLYIYMLGYDVDFGHMEAVALISAPKYAEKQVGYMVAACLLNETNEVLRLVINSVRNDIIGRNETAQCLALTMVGNVGGKEFSESLAPDVMKLLTSSSARPLVKKKAALCLLRLFRKNPDIINLDTWPDKMAELLEERNLGLLVSLMSLLVALVAASPEAYLVCIPKCVRAMERMLKAADVSQDYTYYAIPSPWLQVKTMRVLQYFPAIEDPNSRKSLHEVLRRILQGTETVKNVNKNNAAHGVLFEAIALAMHMDADRELLLHCVSLLGKFISVKEPNIRYLGLENMSRMLQVADVHDDMRSFQPQIVASLKDNDISIRRRALDLLYGLCDVDNAKAIVGELLEYLSVADFAIREELALKTAILAERFAADLPWYVDVILTLIERAGDFVSDDIWHRVVHFVTNHEELQRYAAAKVMACLRQPAVHETMVKIAAYVLGEFSHLLPQQSGGSTVALDVFSQLHAKFGTVSLPTRALMLSAYVKILMRSQAQAQAQAQGQQQGQQQEAHAELQAKVMAVFTRYSSFLDAELQQRAVEYAAMCRRGGQAMADIVAEMPKFPERESSLLKRAEDNEGDAAEASAAKVKAQHSEAQAIVAVTAASPSTIGAGGPAIMRPAAPAAPAAAAASAAGQPSPPVSLVDDDTHQTQQPLPQQQATPQAAPDATSAPTDSFASTEADRLALVPAGANASKDMGDLLGELLSLEPSPPPPPPAATPTGTPPLTAASSLSSPHSASAPLSQLDGSMALALYDGGAPAAAPVVQPLGSVVDWFLTLATRDSGILYEDPHLQIGLKADWHPPHGRLLLFLGNKDTSALTAVRASVGPTAGLRVILSSVPQLLPPRAQLQVHVEVAAVLVPQKVPVLEFAYTNPAGVVVPLRLHLPILLGKFIKPALLSPPDFFSQWKALATPPLKLQEVLCAVKPLPITNMAALLAAHHLQQAANLDPNPNNLVACASLFTETMPPLLLLTRIETDPADLSQLRLTVASSDPSATLCLKEYISDYLSEALPAWLRPPPPPSSAAATAAGLQAPLLQLTAPPSPAASSASAALPSALSPNPASSHNMHQASSAGPFSPPAPTATAAVPGMPTALQVSQLYGSPQAFSPAASGAAAMGMGSISMAGQPPEYLPGSLPPQQQPGHSPYTPQSDSLL